jgi:hypothetical protein
MKGSVFREDGRQHILEHGENVVLPAKAISMSI